MKNEAKKFLRAKREAKARQRQVVLGGPYKKKNTTPLHASHLLYFKTGLFGIKTKNNKDLPVKKKKLK